MIQTNLRKEAERRMTRMVFDRMESQDRVLFGTAEKSILEFEENGDENNV